MSGQLLLLLLTSVLASDETGISGNQHSSSVSQSELLSAAVAEESQARKKAVQLSETQKALMTHLELPDNWTFWFHDDSIQANEQRETISSEEWLQTLQKMESFRNYGQFLNQVKSFKNGSIPLRIYLFKNNIRPSWEEEANKDGGRLLICLPEERDPLRAFEAFLKVAVKVMCSDIGARVNGTTFAYRPECGTTISVWTPVIWTPQRDKEEFNRFKRLIYEEEEIQGPLKVLFRPHKTYSVNTKHNAGANRRPYRQGPIKPPPGFEGSALSSQWFNQTQNDKAAPVVVAVPTPRLDKEAAKQKEEEEQRQREAEALKMMLAAKEEEEKRLLLEQQKKEEAKARKMARRQRQKENRKKRKASNASASSSNSEASSEDEEMSEEEEEVVAVAVADEEPQEEAEPEESIPTASPRVSGYSKFLLPAVATVSTVVLAAAPFAFQYLF